MKKYIWPVVGLVAVIAGAMFLFRKKPAATMNSTGSNQTAGASSVWDSIFGTQSLLARSAAQLNQPKTSGNSQGNNADTIRAIADVSQSGLGILSKLDFGSWFRSSAPAIPDSAPSSGAFDWATWDSASNWQDFNSAGWSEANQPNG